MKNDDKFKMKKRPIGQVRAHILDHVNITKVGSTVFDRMPAINQTRPVSTIRTPQENPFGRKNRPSTPIQGVISMTYANMAEKDLEKKYSQVIKHNVEKMRKHEIKNTRSRLLAAQHIQNSKRQDKSPIDGFKMRKFANIGSRFGNGM